MRTVRRITLAASLVAMVVAGIAIGHEAGAAPRAVSNQHSITMRGVSFRSLDFRVTPQYVPNTGGGVYAQLTGESPPETAYLEADMNLPPGSLVNQVTFFYRDCGVQGEPTGQWYFAAYDPAHAAGNFILPIANTPAGTLNCHTHAFVRGVAPAVKVVATKDYVAGVNSLWRNGGADPTGAPILVVLGAKVRYTCPNGC
jgi:hypothetical protein